MQSTFSRLLKRWTGASAPNAGQCSHEYWKKTALKWWLALVKSHIFHWPKEPTNFYVAWVKLPLHWLKGAQPTKMLPRRNNLISGNASPKLVNAMDPPVLRLQRHPQLSQRPVPATKAMIPSVSLHSLFLFFFFCFDTVMATSPIDQSYDKIHVKQINLHHCKSAIALISNTMRMMHTSNQKTFLFYSRAMA